MAGAIRLLLDKRVADGDITIAGFNDATITQVQMMCASRPNGGFAFTATIEVTLSLPSPGTGH